MPSIPPTIQRLIDRTSAVLEHSVAGTITTAQAIIIAIGKPLMAKLADVYVPLLGSADNRFGRGETFIVVAILYVIGYVCVPCHLKMPKD